MEKDTDRAPLPSMTITRRTDRATNELVGLCRGLLADGHVSPQEAAFLKDWIERNAEFVGMYPFNRLYTQLTEILKDGFIDPDESADLHDTLVRFVGGEALDDAGETASMSTTLPIDQPEPEISFTGAIFVVTGTFLHGQRTLVHQAIETRGGLTSGTPAKSTRYLVIGELGSRDWINSNAGRKIEKAVQLRDAGHPIAIITEAHWGRSL
jgi:NAD-dependent DNA ligase